MTANNTLNETLSKKKKHLTKLILFPHYIKQAKYRKGKNPNTRPKRNHHSHSSINNHTELVTINT
jgi:hypothetical protein